MASYIKALEQSGARTVPLIFDSSNVTKELEKIDHLNGSFYCGGDGSEAYLEFGRLVFERVKNLNDQGQKLPMWGTCLGFQYLAIYAATSGMKVVS